MIAPDEPTAPQPTRPRRDRPSRAALVLGLVLAPLLLAAVVGMILTWPHDDGGTGQRAGLVDVGVEHVTAEVTGTRTEQCESTVEDRLPDGSQPDQVPCLQVLATVTSGAQAGTEIEVWATATLTASDVPDGTRIVVQHYPAADGAPEVVGVVRLRPRRPAGHPRARVRADHRPGRRVARPARDRRPGPRVRGPVAVRPARADRRGERRRPGAVRVGGDHGRRAVPGARVLPAHQHGAARHAHRAPARRRARRPRGGRGAPDRRDDGGGLPAGGAPRRQRGGGAARVSSCAASCSPVSAC